MVHRLENLGVRYLWDHLTQDQQLALLLLEATPAKFDIPDTDNDMQRLLVHWLMGVLHLIPTRVQA